MPDSTTTDRTISMAAIAVTIVALVVVVGVLASNDAAPATDADRVAALAASIRCPFCNGESLADSPSSVAADYRDLIADRVAAGLTDEEIRAEFADNFGDGYLLDGSTSPWRFLLWGIPIAVLAIGILVVVDMRTRRGGKADA